VNKDNTIASDQFDQNQQGGLASPPENIGSQEIGQNKYPKFEMGGDNYSQTQSIQPENIPPAESLTTDIPQVVVGMIPQTNSETTNGISYATIKKRYLASFIDGLIVGTISVLINLPMYMDQIKIMTATFSTGTTPTVSDSVTKGSENPIYTILSVIGIIFGVVYPVYFIGKKGATPGKSLMKIKVIDKETKAVPGLLKAFLREIIGKLASSIFLFLGYLWAIWDKDKQAWHDKIAGTIVINAK
jgi:uncharacterized RDD family membrane protein YckC